MWFRSLFNALARGSCGGSAGQRRRPAAARLQVEALEHRLLLTSYSAALLPSPEGTFRASAVDINSAGTVVGWAAPESHVRRALLWDDGAMIELGTLGGNYSTAYALNDHGQVVGWATRPDDSGTGFLINPEDSDADGTPDRWFRDVNGDGANDLMVEIPVGEDINNLGQVVGGQFLWTPDVPNGTAGTLTDLGPGVYATDINDAGQAAGYRSDGVGGEAQAVLWHNGVTTDLGPGQATDINASGQVTIGGGALWTPTTPNGTVGTYSYFDFGDWGYFAMPNHAGLNNAGQVVGDVISATGDEGGSITDQNAFVIEGTTATYPLVRNPPPGFPGLDTAEAINDARQIVGHTGGSWAGVGPWSAYVLTPINVPLVTVAGATVVEGNSGTVAATFTVSLSEPSDQSVTVMYSIADGSAAAGSDYQAVSGTLTISAGHLTGTISVPILGDRLPEWGETFTVNLSGATNGVIADPRATGGILDDEPRISISDVNKAEGRNRKSTHFVFTVTLSAAYDQPVTLSYRTVDATATTSDNDYIANTGTLNFAPGETTKTITIEVNGDSKREASERFYLDLFDNSSNTLFTKNRGTGTILNDD